MSTAILSAAILAIGAAAAPEAPKPSATATDLARLFVTRESWSQAVQQLSQNAQQQLQSHPGTKLQYPPDFQAKVRGEVEAVLPYDELVGMHAQELAARYAEPELKELLGFFRGTLGQKFLKVQPAEADAVAQKTEQRFRQKMPEVMQRLAKLANAQKGEQQKAPAPKSK